MTEWKKICSMNEIPDLGARVVKTEQGDVAVFRTNGNEVFALHDKCPHKGGPLSQGIVAGKTVTCPLHGWKIGLETGNAEAPDDGHTPCMQTKVDEEGVVWLSLGAA
jgi:nitrite reductase (NADH) small subunit